MIELAAAALVGVLGVARVTRLLVEDDWPPGAWLRNRLFAALDGYGWGSLATCVFCQAPYHAAWSVAWAWLTDLHWTWWLFHTWLAAGYAAAMIVARDTPEHQLGGS